MVARPTADSRARSSALQCRRARPARIWAGVSGLGLILTSYGLYDPITIIRSDRGSDPQKTSFLTQEEDVKSGVWTKPYESRRFFIGGSDARIIMGSDEAALVRLWREKRGEAE